MATLLTSGKTKASRQAAGIYATAEEASIAKNSGLMERIKKFNLKVIVKK